MLLSPQEGRAGGLRDPDPAPLAAAHSRGTNPVPMGILTARAGGVKQVALVGTDRDGGQSRRTTLCQEGPGESIRQGRPRKRGGGEISTRDARTHGGSSRAIPQGPVRPIPRNIAIDYW